MSTGGGMESMARPSQDLAAAWQQGNDNQRCCYFQMPLHYPRYTRADYDTMPEWKLDCLLEEYGLPILGDLEEKRQFAMGAFLWPH